MIISRILVLGGGESAYSAAKLARSNGASVNVILAREEMTNSLIKKFNDIGASVHLKSCINFSKITEYDYIIRSPGIKYDNDLLVLIRKYQGNLISEVEFGYLFASSATYIAITGSNGKTTVATMIYEVLKNRKKNVFLAGNIGIPLTSIVDKLNYKSIVILELSSFQLEDLQLLKPYIAVVLNLSPNHLDSVNSLDFYYNSKMNLLNNLDYRDYFILNSDSQEIINRLPEKPLKIVDISYKKPASITYDDVGIVQNNKYFLKFNKIKTLGKHNHFNLCVALAVGNILNINNKKIKSRLRRFKGVQYRIEFVTRINSIDYYNDSKSTTPESTLAAVNAINNKRIFLILGGRNKNLSFNVITHPAIIKIYAFGEARFEIKKALNNVEVFETIDGVMKKVFSEVPADSVVLFSPSCTSLDQYDNYMDRGKYFNKLVKEYQDEITKKS